MGDDLYDTHFDLLGGELPIIAARVLGRHLRPLLTESASLYERIMLIINKQIAKEGTGPLVRKFQRQALSVTNSATIAYQQLIALRQGILDK